MAEGPPRPKSPRQELFRGQLKVQYTAFANNGFGITLQGIPRFLRYLPPTDHVGLAGSYDKNGRLKYLALSDNDQVLCLQLDAHDPDVNKRFAGKDRDPDELNRTMAETLTSIFANTERYWIAINADRLAAALFLDYGIRIPRLLHLQSLRQSKDVSPASFEALFSLFRAGSFTDSEKHRNEIEDAFNESSLEPKYYKRLCFRASSSFYIQRLFQSDIRDAIELSALIDTTRLTEKALNVLARAIRTSALIDIRKPDYARNDFAEAVFSEDLRSCELSLDRFTTRLRKQHGGSQVVLLTVQDSRTNKKKEIEATLVKTFGRKAELSIDEDSLQILKRIKEPKVTAVMTLGKDEPSASDDMLRTMVFERLIGRESTEQIIPIENVPLVKIIWNSPLSPNVSDPSSSAAARGDRATQSSRPGAQAVKKPLNPSQSRAVVALCNPLDANYRRPIVQIVQGPPGSGKTTMIASMVQWLYKQSREPIYLVTQSNVAVKNIAEKLEKDNFTNYKLIVSSEFKFEWHDHLYEKIKGRVLATDWNFPKTAQKLQEALGNHCRVILCTLSMFMTPKLRKIGLIDRFMPPTTLIVDEASQIEIANYLIPFQLMGCLKRVCFVGDDKQLPPHGVEDLEGLQSIFGVKDLREKAFFLDTQYRMPVPIGDFLSRHIYDGKLKSSHGIQSRECVRLVDCADGMEMNHHFSWINDTEVSAVIQCCRQLHGHNYCVITAYDAQRNEIEKELRKQDLPWKDAVFNVDSFQADFIIISIVRTLGVGFLDDPRRTNVMLSRCKKGMVIVAKRDFLENKGDETLVGKMVQEFEERWMTSAQLAAGTPLFDHNELHGVDVPDDSMGTLYSADAYNPDWSQRGRGAPRGRGTGRGRGAARSVPSDSSPSQNAPLSSNSEDGPSWGAPITFGNSGGKTKKGIVVPDDDGWGEGAEAWSVQDDASVAEDLSAELEEEATAARFDEQDDDPPLEDRTPSPEAPPAPKLAMSEREYFDWSEEPTDNMTAWTPVGPNGQSENADRPESAAGWTKAKKGKGRAQRGKPPGSNAPAGDARGRGRGQGKGQGKGKGGRSNSNPVMVPEDVITPLNEADWNNMNATTWAADPGGATWD